MVNPIRVGLRSWHNPPTRFQLPGVWRVMAYGSSSSSAAMLYQVRSPYIGGGYYCG